MIENLLKKTSELNEEIKKLQKFMFSDDYKNMKRFERLLIRLELSDMKRLYTVLSTRARMHENDKKLLPGAQNEEVKSQIKEINKETEEVKIYKPKKSEVEKACIRNGNIPNNFYKPMNYTTDEICEILDSGKCCGIYYAIINFGSHPCCYIAIPSGNMLYKSNYDLISSKIDVHGGFTYSEEKLINSITRKPIFPKLEGQKYWFVGWDYAHVGDYYISNVTSLDGHKYTTTEMRSDVFSVCTQLKQKKFI